jgi:hypothetical protein
MQQGGEGGFDRTPRQYNDFNNGGGGDRRPRRDERVDMGGDSVSGGGGALIFRSSRPARS